MQVLEGVLKWLPIVLPLLVLVVQALMGWGFWSFKQEFMSRTDCDTCRHELESEQELHAARLVKLEQADAVIEDREKNRVTTHDLEKIYERVNLVDRKVSNQNGELKAMRRELGLINQHLLERQ